MGIVKRVVIGQDQGGEMSQGKETGPGRETLQGSESVIEMGIGSMSAGIIVQMKTTLDIQRKSAHLDAIAAQMRDLAVREAPAAHIDANVALLGSALTQRGIDLLLIGKAAAYCDGEDVISVPYQGE
jgi:hypothetical protein